MIKINTISNNSIKVLVVIMAAVGAAVLDMEAVMFMVVVVVVSPLVDLLLISTTNAVAEDRWAGSAIKKIP